MGQASMASPLTPINNNTLNAATNPTTTRRFEEYEVKSHTVQSTVQPTVQSTCETGDEMDSGNDSNQSSPFVSQVRDRDGDDKDVGRGNDNGSTGSTSSTANHSTNSSVNINTNQENVSPNKNRHSRVMSGNELSPLKILSPTFESIEAELLSPPEKNATTNGRSPRRVSPAARFPIKVNSTPATPAKHPVEKVPEKIEEEVPQKVEEKIQEKEITLEDALRNNEGLTKAIQIFEDQDLMMNDAEDEADLTSASFDREPQQQQPSTEEGNTALEDTMVSEFSTFSAVPDMAMFARLGQSPSKQGSDLGRSPTGPARGRPDPSPSRRSRPLTMHESPNTSNLLMDFTDQISNFSSRYGQQQDPLDQTHASRRMSARPAAATPLRQQSNLLDFDIPPLPTPRSIPSVTPRELESLKSGFLSEISSLKASLSGKEAEAASLKAAVGDAEKRVGECMEELREAQSSREALDEERANWERRGREMEAVLRKVKEEIVLGQREREALESQLEETEKRREAAEMMAQEAESKMAGMRAGKAVAASSSSPTPSGDGGECAKCGSHSVKSPDRAGGKAANNNAKEVEMAVERVARELHALYKSKHETKVAALKKSYETRWEKRVRELETRAEDLAVENDRLRGAAAADAARADPAQVAAAVSEQFKARAARDAAQIRELRAEVEKLEAVIGSVKADNGDLRTLLEKERVEKGELVQLAEEMMQMQSMQSFIQKEQGQQQQQQQQPQSHHHLQRQHPEPRSPAPSQSPARSSIAGPRRTSSGPTTTPAPVRHTPARARGDTATGTTTTTTTGEPLRSSIIGRPSSLQAPRSIKKPTASRIGGLTQQHHERNKNGGSLPGGGIPRPGSGASSASSRSGIMSSIEKMGNYRGRGD